MAERSESEVSAAIMEAGRKLGNELRVTTRGSGKICARAGCFRFVTHWKWEEPLLFGASLDF